MGGFTEIIMNANQGLGAMAGLQGAVRSAYSGAIGRGGENVGYRQSEQYSASGIGQIKGRADKWTSAYNLNRRIPGLAPGQDIRSLEYGMFKKIGSSFQSAAAAKTRGGLTAQSAAASPVVLGAAVAGNTSSVVINVPINFQGIPRQAGDIVEKTLTKALNSYGDGAIHP